MSSLTKKSLFFMVLFIVCNQTFSGESDDGESDEEADARINECIDNVHILFDRQMDEFFSFKLAMLSLSESVIGSMKSTAILLYHFQNNENAFLQYIDFTTLIAKYHEIIGLFNYIIIHSENRNKILSGTEIRDILGYFQSLVIKVENTPSLFLSVASTSQNSTIEQIRIAQLVQKLAPKSPKTFCSGPNVLVELLCRTSLAVMFDRTEKELNAMDVKEAFVYFFRNRTHLDFTMANTGFINNPELLEVFSNSGNANLEDKQKFALHTMVNYFSHLMDTAYVIVLDSMKYSHLLPTVNEYCSGRFQTTASSSS